MTADGSTGLVEVAEMDGWIARTSPATHRLAVVTNNGPEIHAVASVHFRHIKIYACMEITDLFEQCGFEFSD